MYAYIFNLISFFRTGLLFIFNSLLHDHGLVIVDLARIHAPHGHVDLLWPHGDDPAGALDGAHPRASVTAGGVGDPEPAVHVGAEPGREESGPAS